MAAVDPEAVAEAEWVRGAVGAVQVPQLGAKEAVADLRPKATTVPPATSIRSATSTGRNYLQAIAILAQLNQCKRTTTASTMWMRWNSQQWALGLMSATAKHT